MVFCRINPNLVMRWATVNGDRRSRDEAPIFRKKEPSFLRTRQICFAPWPHQFRSQPSHRIWKKKVGSLMKTCHTAGHEKTKSSNRRQIDRAQSALQVHSSPLGAPLGQGDRGGREGQDV